MMTDRNASPVNPLPPVVWALAGPIALIELALWLGSTGLIGGQAALGWRVEAIQTFGYSERILDWMIANSTFPPEHLMRFVTYPFIHGGFTHMVFVFVFILALGKMVAEVFSPAAVLAVFFGSSILGALVFGLALNDPAWLIGGYPGVYGLIGAFTFLLWTRLGAAGANRYRAFTLIGFLLGIQMVFGLLFGASNEWVADLTGFVTGFFMSFVVSPGGWQGALARMRSR